MINVFAFGRMGAEPSLRTACSGKAARLVTGCCGRRLLQRPAPQRLCLADALVTHSSVPQHLQAQFVGHFADGHGVGQVLLVGEHQQHGVFQLVLVQLWCRGAD